MNEREAELQHFIGKLRNVGITTFYDQRLRNDGKRLENYAFRKGNKVKYIIEPVIDRVWGQSYYFKPVKDKIIYVPLPDRMYYEQLFEIINSTI